MLRIRLQLPHRYTQHYRYYDILHDALVNAWLAAGAKPAEVIGSSALCWNFAALGGHQGKQASVHTLVVSTPEPRLAPYLARFDPHNVHYIRAHTEEFIDFSSAQSHIEDDPILTMQERLGVFLLSPVAISQRKKPNNKQKQKKWYRNLNEVDISAAVNYRLSRLAQREVKLQIYADSLYLRANPQHSVKVHTKRMKNGHEAYVIAMQAPLLLVGSDEDLRLAWYAGIGEKTRNGFGCVGLIEQGVGRGVKR